YEERGAHVRRGEGVEDAVGAGGDPRRHRVPVAAGDDAVEAGDVEVVLHVDRQGVDPRRRGFGDRGWRRPEWEREDGGHVIPFARGSPLTPPAPLPQTGERGEQDSGGV